jgi:hypothetical protein
MLTRSNATETKVLVVRLCLALALTFAREAVADFTNTSANFSLGYGAQATSGSPWNTTETSGANTATTLGSFSFIPTLSGPPFSSSGPIFPSRVLGDGDYGVGRSGWSKDFLVSLTGSYNTALPVWAENVKLTLNITSISIYGVQYSGFGTGTMQFQETTSGHTASSSAITLNVAADINDPGISPFATAANWKQLDWDPADFAVAGTTSTRTFNLGTFTSTQGYAIDGFEIEGNVVLTYIPEPMSVWLLGIGGLLLWRRGMRNG